MENKGDRVAVAIASGVVVLVIGGAYLTLSDLGWLENKARIEYVQTTKNVPKPYPSPSPVIEYVEVPSAPVTVTHTQTATVEVPVVNPGGTTGGFEGCVEALRAADALARAVETGNGLDFAAANYWAYRSVCAA